MSTTSENPLATSKCVLSKTGGSIKIYSSFLQWDPDIKLADSSQGISLGFKAIKSIHVNPNPSKEKSVLKITTYNTNPSLVEPGSGSVLKEIGYLFYFSGEDAIRDRENIKSNLADQLSKFRSQHISNVSQKPSSASSSSLESTPSGSAASSASIQVPVLASKTQDSVPSLGLSSFSLGKDNEKKASGSIPLVKLSPEDIKYRGLLLSKRKDLLYLHKELVLNGIISEEEFWDTRKNLLDLQKAQISQEKGVPSCILSDIRPTAGIGGEIKYTLTPTLINSIFLHHQGVHRAYKENVPDKISDREFWTLYFQSKLFNKNRDTETPFSTTSNSSVNLLDKYLSNDNEESLPQTVPIHANPAPFLNLTTELKDDDQKNTLMPDRKAIQLIKKYNRHSEIVLESTSKRFADKNSKKKINLEDLIKIEDLDSGKTHQFTIPLQINSESNYLENMGSFSKLVNESSSTPNESNEEQKYKKLQTQSTNNKASEYYFIDSESKYGKFLEFSSGKQGLSGSNLEQWIKNLGEKKDFLTFHVNVCEILSQFWKTLKLKDSYSRSKLLKMTDLLERFNSQYNFIAGNLEYEQGRSSEISPIKTLDSLKTALGKALEKSQELLQKQRANTHKLKV